MRLVDHPFDPFAASKIKALFKTALDDDDPLGAARSNVNDGCIDRSGRAARANPSLIGQRHT
ncbi:MAG: hypothetical protein ABSE69_19455, partial [Roseiarcus sp.]